MDGVPKACEGKIISYLGRDSAHKDKMKGTKKGLWV